MSEALVTLTASPLLGRLQALAPALTETGCRVWVVGGAIRDLLSGADEFVDIDLAVLGDPRRFGEAVVRSAGGTFVMLDEARDTVRAVLPDGCYYDLTRVDVSIEADLARRDLTVNAMALPLADAFADPSSVPLLDPFGGLADVREQTIRMVSEAALTADPLRLLRVYRFAAELASEVEPATASAVRRHAALVARPAPERVARELFLLLATDRAAPTLRLMDAAGLLGKVLPETEAMRGVTQNEYHHLDVLDHSLETVACLETVLADLPGLAGEAAPRLQAFLAEELAAERPRHALLKFVSLLHDIGKPSAKAVRKGRVTFYTHNKTGAGMMRDVCERLRLSARETEEAVRYVDRHMLPGDIEAGGALDERREMRYFRRNGEQGLALVLLSLADGMATRGPLADPDRTRRFREFAHKLANDYYGVVGRKLQSPPLVNGRDLIAEFGLDPGPELGRLLKRIRHRQLVGEVRTREEALALAARELAKRPHAEE